MAEITTETTPVASPTPSMPSSQAVSPTDFPQPLNADTVNLHKEKASIPEGDPLEQYRDIFNETPGLLVHLQRNIGSEHTIAQVLEQADSIFQLLSPNTRKLIKESGAGNDPYILKDLAERGRERTGLLKENSELKLRIASLEAQLQGKPMLHQIDASSAQVLTGVDLRQLELDLAYKYSKETTPDRRAVLQEQLTAVQKTLYQSGSNHPRPLRK